MSEISTFAPTAANLWAIVQSYGIDPNPLFQAQGINIDFPIDADLRLSYEKFDAVRASAVELSGDEAIGLRAGTFMHPSHLGPLGYAWLASRSLRIALRRWQRFARVLNSNSSLDLTERGELLLVEFVIDLPSMNAPARDDGAAAALMTMMRYNFGPHLKPVSVLLKRPRPVDPEPWHRFYGCNPEFGSDNNCISLPIKHADTILATANPHLARLNEEMVVRYLERLDSEDFTHRVRSEIVRQLPCGRFDQSLVAEALHMTARTIRRRLQTHDLTFNSLLNEVRRELADQFISDGNLSMTEISLMLGFSEGSSFTRAFRSWNGRSPTEARKEILAGA